MKLLEQVCQLVQDHDNNTYEAALKCILDGIKTVAAKGHMTYVYYRLKDNLGLSETEIYDLVDYLAKEGFTARVASNDDLFVSWAEAFKERVCPQCGKYHDENRKQAHP
jgi:hypothetical protein